MKIKKINENTLRVLVGDPYPTGALVYDRDSSEDLDPGEPLPMKVEISNQRVTITKQLDKDDRVWGLGQNTGGLDKRGGVYRSFCTDVPHHLPRAKSLYGAHNFLLIGTREPVGLFVDVAAPVRFDVGHTDHGMLEVTVESSDADMYFFHEGTVRELALVFRSLMGSGYVPPLWAFGYHQSRWGYQTRNEVEKIASVFKEKEIPCDAIYLDIDYMDGYKVFTVNEEAFPGFAALVQKLAEEGIQLVPIVDAGVKIEPGYALYDEGLAQNHFCTDESGEPFVAAVWPGKVHFPDFMNPETRDWFGGWYQHLLDMGIEGFWNDMNEPAVFYTPHRLKAMVQLAEESQGKNMGITEFFHLMDTVKSLSNHPDDFKLFFHRSDHGRINHHQVHNLYGHLMTKAASESIDRIMCGKRTLLLTRASTVGTGRYAGIWTGDNHSWWEHILLNLQMLPAVNQCGILFVGADTGGFSGDATGQLLIRWSQLSLFTPLFRNHSALGTRPQEPFAFEESTTHTMRNLIQLRYSLIPYLYGEYIKATQRKGLVFQPLFFEYADEAAEQVEDQLLVGESLMISPVYRENARSRTVYVPETMLLWRAFDSVIRRLSVWQPGIHSVTVQLEEALIWIRKDRLLVLTEPAINTARMRFNHLRVLGFVDQEAVYEYYEDDGVSTPYAPGKHGLIQFRVLRQNGVYHVTIKREGNPQATTCHFILSDPLGSIREYTCCMEENSSGPIEFEC